jgi:hypothetical protein
MPTTKQQKAISKVLETPGIPIGRAMREAGYSEKTAKNPKDLTQSRAWAELMDQYLSDEEVAKVHKELLNATVVDHMVFPRYKGPGEDLPAEELEAQPNGGALKRRHITEGSTLTDKDIEELLAEANCQLRKIVHSETARHVYFWSPDNGARKAAIELAYKLKGRLTQKIEADFKGVTVALVEFIGDDDKDADS